MEVIQSLKHLQISIINNIRNYGQLRTIGATQKQVKNVVKREGRFLGFIGILFGIMLAMLCSLVILAKGVNITNYIACAIMTVIVCSIIVNVSIKKPVKIAMKVSPIEAVRVMITDNLKTTVQNKYRKFTPISLGIMNFKREPKKYGGCYIIESWRNYFISGIISFTFAISGTDGTILFW